MLKIKQSHEAWHNSKAAGGIPPRPHAPNTHLHVGPAQRQCKPSKHPVPPPSPLRTQDAAVLAAALAHWGGLQAQAGAMQRELDAVAKLAEAKDSELRCVGVRHRLWIGRGWPPGGLR